MFQGRELDLDLGVGIDFDRILLETGSRYTLCSENVPLEQWYWYRYAISLIIPIFT